MGVRYSGPLVSIVAVAAGPGGAVANYQTAFTMPTTGKRVKIVKIMWHNRTGANGNLQVGYGDLTGAGSLFRQILPDIYMLTGFDGELTEDEIPMGGNTPEGMMPDTAVPTGTTGNILVGTIIPGVGAVPNNVQVRIEVEVD